MVNRSKSSVDPPVAHFRTADHAGELAEDGPDYLAKANLYRRKVVQTGESGGERVRSGSRFFVGARSGFLLGYNDGLVTVARSADDISADGVDGVVVTYVQSGQFRLVADGRDETFEPGDLVVEDTRRPRRSTVGFLRTGTLFIPRHRFNEAIDVPSEQLTLLRGLSRAPLAPTLTQQIRFLMQSLDTLSPNEFEAALDAAIDVALVMLRKQAARERPVEDHILKTAKTFIEANFRNVELTPNTIARAVGCSASVPHCGNSPR